MDVDAIEDEMMKKSVLAQILNFGQTPKRVRDGSVALRQQLMRWQLFDRQHPARTVSATPVAFPSAAMATTHPAVLVPVLQPVR